MFQILLGRDLLIYFVQNLIRWRFFRGLGITIKRHSQSEDGGQDQQKRNEFSWFPFSIVYSKFEIILKNSETLKKSTQF